MPSSSAPPPVATLLLIAVLPSLLSAGCASLNAASASKLSPDVVGSALRFHTAPRVPPREKGVSRSLARLKQMARVQSISANVDTNMGLSWEHKMFSQNVRSRYEQFISSTKGKIASQKPIPPGEAINMLKTSRLALRGKLGEFASSGTEMGESSSSAPLSIRVLDVGTGTGEMVPYIYQAASVEGDQNPLDALHIVGIDISDAMVKLAREKYPSARFIVGDIDESTSPSSGLKGERFDVIILNSCISHLYDPSSTIKRLAMDHLQPGGRIVLSHERGRSFVDRMCSLDSMMFRHPLPTLVQLEKCIEELPLVIEIYEDEGAEKQPEDPNREMFPFYCAVLKRETED